MWEKRRSLKFDYWFLQFSKSLELLFNVSHFVKKEEEEEKEEEE